MTLRTRLALAVVTVAVLPVLVVAIAVGALVPASAEHRSRDLLAAATSAAARGLGDACARAGLLAQLAQDRSAGPAGAAGAADQVASQPGVRGVVVTSAGGAAVTRGPVTPSAVPGACAIAGDAVSARTAGAPVVAVAVDIRPPLSGSAGSLAVVGPGGRVLAGSPGVGDHRLHRVVGVVAVPGVSVVGSVTAPDPVPLRLGLAALVVCVAIGAAVLGRRYAAGAAAPLVAVTDAAGRLAAGDLGTRVPVRGGGEPARLAEAFNAMAVDLERTVADLRRSQERLRRDLERIGGALAATHDLDALLEVVLDTALDSAGAAAGAIYVREADGTLRMAVGRGLEQRVAQPPVALAPGQGVLGGVGEAGVAVVTSAGPQAQRQSRDHPALDPAEPRAGDVLAVPLRRDGAVVAVLSLYDPLDGRPFDQGDLDAVGALADQAGIAVANVALHREAERLSVTDPLTGLSNRRALMRQLAREVDRAARFGRSLSLLLLDVDRFKNVNDTYGHAAGDVVLVATARLLRDAVRDVDTVARYGGEELVAVLPETDLEGAGRLAERVCARMRATPIPVGDQRLTVTVSVGVAAFPWHGDSASLLLRAADAAMYQAKESGRDTWRAAESDPLPG